MLTKCDNNQDTAEMMNKLIDRLEKNKIDNYKIDKVDQYQIETVNDGLEWLWQQMNK